jgi:hypothetical protein
MSHLCNRHVREFLILARTWFAFGLPSKTGCDTVRREEKSGGERKEVSSPRQHGSPATGRGTPAMGTQRAGARRGEAVVGEKLRDGYGRFGFWKMNSGIPRPGAWAPLGSGSGMRGTTHARYTRDVGAELGGGGGAPRAGMWMRARRARWLGQALARGGGLGWGRDSRRAGPRGCRARRGGGEAGLAGGGGGWRGGRS